MYIVLFEIIPVPVPLSNPKVVIPSVHSRGSWFGDPYHSLNQEGVGVFCGHPNPQKPSLKTLKYFCESFPKISILSI